MGIDKVHVLVLVVVIGISLGEELRRNSHFIRQKSRKGLNDFDRSILNHEPRDVDFPILSKQLFRLKKMAKFENTHKLMQSEPFRRFNVRHNHHSRKPRRFRQSGEHEISDKYSPRLNVDHLERRRRINKNRSLPFNQLRRKGRYHLNKAERNNNFNVTRLLNTVKPKRLHRRLHKHRGRKHTGKNRRRDWSRRMVVSGKRSRDVDRLMALKFGFPHASRPSEDSVRRRLKKLRLMQYEVELDGELKTVEDCVSKYGCSVPQLGVPVCGSDGNTYANDCVLNINSCISIGNGAEEITIKHTGDCDPGENTQERMQRHTDIPILH